MDTLVGSSGTMMITITETLGYHYRSLALDALPSPFQTSVNGLLGITGAIAALVHFVVLGGVKLGLWMLLPPALLFSVIVPRSETFGSVSAFAGTLPSQEQFEAVSADHENFNLQSILPAPLYAQRLNESAKEPEFRELLQPEFRELLDHAFLGGCRKMIEAGQEATSEKNPASLKAKAQAEFESYGDNYHAQLSDNTLEYLARLKAAYPKLWDMELTDKQYNEAISEWKMRLAEGFDEENRPKAAIEARYWLQRNNSFSCRQMWNFVYGGLYRYADKMVKKVVARGDKHGIEPRGLLGDLLTAKGVSKGDMKGVFIGEDEADIQPKLNALCRIVAQHVLRKEIGKGTGALEAGR